MTPEEPTAPQQPTEPLDALDSHLPGSTSARRGLLTAAIAVLALVLAGVTGAALAQGGSQAPQTALAAATGAAAPSDGGPGAAKGRAKAWKKGLAMRGRGHLLGAGGALHGSFVVPDGSGGFRTLVMQRGKATKVSDTSITVRSDDGFEQTYAITATTAVGADRAGARGIAKGADVAVMGEDKGNSVKALHLADLAAFGGGRGLGGMMGGPGMMHGPDDGDGPDDAPDTVPAPNTTAEGSAFGV